MASQQARHSHRQNRTLVSNHKSTAEICRAFKILTNAPYRILAYMIHALTLHETNAHYMTLAYRLQGTNAHVPGGHITIITVALILNPSPLCLFGMCVVCSSFSFHFFYLHFLTSAREVDLQSVSKKHSFGYNL